MITPMRWIGRVFTFDLPVGWFPAVLERLAGTPARAEALLRGVDEAVMSIQPEGKWSAKEHVAHLVDLEELDRRRLDEFLAGAPELAAADMDNRKTHGAGHNRRPASQILSDLAACRADLVARLMSLPEDEVARSARHPRLGQRMRLIDWAAFVADHDDHHLAHARAVLLRVSRGIPSSDGRTLADPAVGGRGAPAEDP